MDKKKSLAEHILDEDFNGLEDRIQNTPYCQPLHRLALLKGLENKSEVLSYEHRSTEEDEADLNTEHTVAFVTFNPKQKATKKSKQTKRGSKPTKASSLQRKQTQETMSKQTKGTSDFAGWLLSCQQAEGSKTVEKVGKKKKKRKKKAKTALDKNIKKSVEEKEEIASEALARLYDAQGHYKKALKMYERLSLINPQKSSFFAPLIENLKNKLQ